MLRNFSGERVDAMELLVATAFGCRVRAWQLERLPYVGERKATSVCLPT